MIARNPEFTAKGVKRSLTRSGLVRLSVALDPAVFSKLQAIAAEHRSSVAEQVRIYVEIGLDEIQGEADAE